MPPAVLNVGGAGKSFVGAGPVGACLDDGILLGNKEVLLLVLGGNIGRDEGSIAEAGSGMLSRSVNPSRFDRDIEPLGASRVSKERCCSERGGGGERGVIPVGDICPCLPVAYCGAATGIFPDVGLVYFFAVVGVPLLSPLDDAVDAAEWFPSVLNVFGAGGAR
jgi:hypothetical protein